MKKLFTTLVATLLMLSTSAPALAMESTTTVGVSAGVSTSIKAERKQVREELKEKQKEIRDEFKEKEKEIRDELKGKMKEVRDDLRDKMKEVRDEFKQKRDELMHKLVRRELTLRGELTAMSSTSLTVKVSSVRPDFHQQWSSVSSSTFPGKDTLVTVKVDNKTKVVRRFNGKSSLDELTVGDTMQIVGRLNDDGTVSARVVKDDSIQMTHRVHHGTIASLDAAAKSFSMTLMSSSSVAFTVHTDSNTKFMVPGVTSTSFANLKVSDKVWVRGIVNTRTKVIDANVVKVKLPEILPVPAPTPTPTPTSTATST